LTSSSHVWQAREQLQKLITILVNSPTPAEWWCWQLFLITGAWSPVHHPETTLISFIGFRIATPFKSWENLCKKLTMVMIINIHPKERPARNYMTVWTVSISSGVHAQQKFQGPPLRAQWDHFEYVLEAGISQVGGVLNIVWWTRSRTRHTHEPITAAHLSDLRT
jgi:hypothetical protein